MEQPRFREPLKDVEISRIFNIPISTLQDWKRNPKENWRWRIYQHLKWHGRDSAVLQDG